MLQMEWTTLLSALLAALVIGALLGRRLFRKASQDNSSLKGQLDELKQQYQNYQINVTEHFNRTTDLIEELNKNYGRIQEHLNFGAEQFVRPEYQLDSARTAETSLEDLSPPPDFNTEPVGPRDYAPKAPAEEGTLSETYGLKRSDFTEKS